MKILGHGVFHCLYPIFKQITVKLNNGILFLIISIIVFFSCNSNKEINIELEIIKSTAKDINTPTLVFRATNHSDKDFYILSFNPLTSISFINNKGIDISEYFWTMYSNNMPIPDPIASYDAPPTTEQKDFNYEATRIDFLKTNSLFLDSIPQKHRFEILKLLNSKYQLVTLIKAGEVYEQHFPIKFIEINTINQIELSYNYKEIINNSNGYTTIMIDNKKYMLQNLPIDRVGNYQLFRGKMKYKLTVDGRWFD